ncbi:amidohydrolase family protein [Rhodocaloribacter litoris]|uniref:amidohydrolase family protein n=1 Tax=Rhodocaloribacter litoris TaxID=2558931 RepID=UPI001422764B|nr:amidohydrolase family protein [Rhodocaloribacter litoris]QXD14721.1 amidohydrolase family protein [Rhodocaloribacter litoris]
MRPLLLTLLALLACLPATAQRPGFSDEVRRFIRVEAPVVVLRDVKLIDGTGAPARMHQTIVVEGDRIAAVGPVEEVRVPEGAAVLELAGHTVFPGFVGLHNHTFYTTASRRVQLNYSAPVLYLASGVTTIRTTGSYAPYSEINLKRSIEAGEMVGPRMFITGPYLTGGEGMTYMTRLSGPEDARRVVRYWAEEGVDWFKAYTLITRDELAAAIDEAHRHGLKVTGHLCSVSFTEAVELGIDNLEHGFFTNTDYDDDKPADRCPDDFRESLLEVDLDGEAVRETFRVMIEHDVPMTSTLAVYELIVPDRPPLEQRVLDAMAPEVREEYLATRERIRERGGDFWARLFKKAQAYEYRFVRAGGTLAAGVDPTGIGGALPGYGDQRNFELLVEAGFTPVEVVQIMSANGAKVLGIDEKVGTVTPGKQADLIVIDGDPETDPAQIRNVTLVFKAGVGYDAAKLIESVRGLVGIR